MESLIANGPDGNRHTQFGDFQNLYDTIGSVSPPRPLDRSGSGDASPRTRDSLDQQKNLPATHSRREVEIHLEFVRLAKNYSKGSGLGASRNGKTRIALPAGWSCL